MATAACSALLAAALLCNAPVVPAPLTLHGTPISGTVEVYRLAAPAVTPAVTPGGEQEPSQSSKRLVWRGTLVGALVGGTIGVVLSRINNDDLHPTCLWFSGIGAGIGAVAVAGSVL